MRKKSVNETRYDENILKLFKQKPVLAYIMKYTVKEFADMDVSDIANCIEGEPKVQEERVDEYGQNMEDFVSPMIKGSDTNHKSKTEGTVFFDIVFNVFVPGDPDAIKMIINVEAQNEVQNLGYHIVTRGIYYAARELSSEKNVEFVKSNYQDIKKVYSIWVCINSDKETENTITDYSFAKNDLVGHYPRKDYYDLISVIQICLSKDIVEAADDGTKLLRLLEAFVSTKITNEERKKIVVDEFGIPYSNDVERSVEDMCNASQGIRNEGIAQGMAQGIINGRIAAYLDMGLSKEDICRKLAMSEADVTSIMASLEDAPV